MNYTTARQVTVEFINENTVTHLMEWCNINIGSILRGEWTCSYNSKMATFYFAKEVDASMFILRWK